jgi:hypothetical protein
VAAVKISVVLVTPSRLLALSNVRKAAVTFANAISSGDVHCDL